MKCLFYVAESLSLRVKFKGSYVYQPAFSGSMVVALCGITSCMALVVSQARKRIAHTDADFLAGGGALSALLACEDKKTVAVA